MCGKGGPAPFAFRLIAFVTEQQDLAFVARVGRLRQLRGNDLEVDQAGAHCDVGEGCPTTTVYLAGLHIAGIFLWSAR